MRFLAGLRSTSIGFTSVAVILAAQCAFAQPPTDPHLPIPPGYDYPADQSTLLQYRDQNDVSAMRKHAWMVFAGMTQSAPGGEAIWETWHPMDETFSPGAVPQGAGRRKPKFQRPRQFTELGVMGQPQAVGASLLSFVLFNPDGHRFIRQNKFYLQDTLIAARTANDANIKDFPREAVTVKVVWWPLNKGGLSPLPVWDAKPTKPVDAGLGNNTKPIGNDFSTWDRVVAIDSTRTDIPADETTTIKFFDPSATNPEFAPLVDRPGSRVIPLNRLYHFQLTQEDVENSKADLNRAFRRLYGRDVAAGDYVAMVCFHFTTKEIPDWVWATLWWHDKPDEGPFAQDRPTQVSGVWKNYLMNVAYSTDTPKEQDGSAKVTFNPWLEARFANGTLSNCMTCHQRAVWPPVNFLPITRGGMQASDPFFHNKTRLDFLWSIAFESKDTP